MLSPGIPNMDTAAAHSVSQAADLSLESTCQYAWNERHAAGRALGTHSGGYVHTNPRIMLAKHQRRYDATLAQR